MAGKDGKLAIIKEQVTITLGALATLDTTVGAGPVLAQGYRIIKTVWSATAVALSSNQGSGMILGIVNKDLSAAQIEASLEANGPLFRGDRDREELAERFTKQLGQVTSTLVSGTEVVFKGPTGGSPTETILRWSFPLGAAGWNWWIYNLGSTLTTGASAHVLATHYGVWLD